MFTQVSEEVFTIECDICEYDIAYFYEDGTPDQMIVEDDWHKTDTGVICSACYVPPNPELNLDKWTIQDLLLIAPPRDYHTRKGIIDHIDIELITDELRSKYGVECHES